MLDIEISFSNDLTSDNVIRDIMCIEKEVYVEEFRGSYTNIISRFRKNVSGK